MEWQLVVVAFGALLVVVGLAVVVHAVISRERQDPVDPDEPGAEEFLEQYFALEEFNDEELRERLEQLRGVSGIR